MLYWYVMSHCVSIMLDVCYNYGLDKYSLINLLKFACMLFNSKGYKFYYLNMLLTKHR